MEIKVILKRKVRNEMHEELTPLLIQLRNMANEQTGYISGQTLINMDDPTEYLVLSSWKSVNDWENWLGCEKRKEVQAKVDDILDEPTFYQVYCNG